MEVLKVKQHNSYKILLEIFFLSIELVLNAQLKRYTRFLNTHKQALRRIEDALGSNITQTWDFDLNPVELKVKTFPSLLNIQISSPVFTL
jgi:hypothetical protein